MKFTIARKVLLKSVQLAERIAGKNMSLPVLSTVLLEVGDKEVTLKATNLDVGLEQKMVADVSEEGVVAVPAATLSRTLSGISIDGDVECEMVNKNLVLSTKISTTLIKSVSHEDFPTIPTISEGTELQITKEDFVEGIKSVAYSASLSDIKPEIASVYIHGDGEGGVVFVATDSFRLAQKRFSNKKYSVEEGVIIPIKNATEIVRILEHVEGSTTVLFDQNQLSIMAGEVYFMSRVVNGVYPDYQQILPKEHTTQVVVLKDDLVNNLKLSQVFSDKFQKITFSANPGKKLFEISSRSSDVGESMVKITGSFDGDDFDANFNLRYVLDGVQAIHSDSVVMRYSADREVLILSGINDPSYLYLVKPMNR